jgi:hypothetical protein
VFSLITLALGIATFCIRVSITDEILHLVATLIAWLFVALSVAVLAVPLKLLFVIALLCATKKSRFLNRKKHFATNQVI